VEEGAQRLLLEGEGGRVRRLRQDTDVGGDTDGDVYVEAHAHAHNMESWACVILFTM
jgi:hypothetical protein